MPKFVVNAVGRPVLPAGLVEVLLRRTAGPKYLRYVPNADHSLRGSDAQDSILAFYQAILTRSGAAEVLVEDGQATARSACKTEDEADGGEPLAGDEPQGPRLPAGSHRPGLQEVAAGAGTTKGVYVAKVAKPETGWTAFFVELVFDSGDEGAVQVHDAGEHRARRVAA